MLGVVKDEEPTDPVHVRAPVAPAVASHANRVAGPIEQLRGRSGLAERHHVHRRGVARIGIRSVPSNRVPADYEAKSPYFTGRIWFVLPLLHANQRRASAESAKGPAVETHVHAWQRYVLEHRLGDG